MTNLALLPPSSRLPPLRRINEHPIDVLIALVDYLRAIYTPPVHGTRRVGRKVLKARSASRSAEDSLDELRADPFERAYAVRWLTRLVTRTALLEDADADEDAPAAENNADALVRAATALLAACAGTSAARTLTRTYVFAAPSADASHDVRVLLTDVPIATDGEAPTVGTQTWGSACLLAEMVVEDPARFGLGGRSGEVRVLELGAGTGLVSLALAKHLAQTHRESAAKTSIVASDYHPAVLENLDRNIEANFPHGTPSTVSLAAHRLDWSDYSRGDCDLREESFDVVLGADVVYEPQHILWIRDCVHALLRKPASAAGDRAARAPRFHLVMPLRPTHAVESRAVREAFPAAPYGDNVRPETLCILEEETVLCEVDDVRPGEQIEYVHFVIGWS
ncbi:putative methyltransferase-domain-containing protein [Epithele typhae]|uniref:putative methyltransferase-domain-containing protein n=1 Tax=Epithele typhae TaxID=378194 RepID=UPI0020087817|nr:putative methyltransferase-domain-containing protein [Epithele typhae]KAH9944960.1 putative methyltransferase-domain-containing protein [Epithele typhae]